MLISKAPLRTLSMTGRQHSNLNETISGSFIKYTVVQISSYNSDTMTLISKVELKL